jgi:hypothetical protein
MTRTRTSFYVLVWLMASIAIAVLAGSNLPRYRGLFISGIKTRGVVLRTEPRNHALVCYWYRVNGIAYENCGNIGAGNPRFEALDPGMPVVLYFDTANPKISELGEPGPRLRNEVISVVMAVLFLPTILVAILAIGIRLKRISLERLFPL